VPRIERNDDAGALSALLSDHDVAVNDFECPMVSNFRQHDEGTLFTIDPGLPAIWPGGPEWTP